LINAMRTGLAVQEENKLRNVIRTELVVQEEKKFEAVRIF